MADPIKAVCRRDFFPAYRSSGYRPLSEIRLVVLHDTEGGTADGIANYFRSSNAGGSTQLVVDDEKCQRCLSDATQCWGAASAPQISSNYHGVHIEQCGYAKWSLVVWKSHLKTIQRAAYKTALHCKKYHLPLVFRTSANLVENPRIRGITTHNEITRASKVLDPAKSWKYSHTDPGPFWPRRLFMFYVRKYAKEMGYA